MLVPSSARSFVLLSLFSSKTNYPKKETIRIPKVFTYSHQLYIFICRLFFLLRTFFYLQETHPQLAHLLDIFFLQEKKSSFAGTSLSYQVDMVGVCGERESKRKENSSKQTMRFLRSTDRWIDARRVTNMLCCKFVKMMHIVWNWKRKLFRTICYAFPFSTVGRHFLTRN